MTIKQLDNLVKTKDLRSERPDQNEFDGMVESAKLQLNDAVLRGLSRNGQFQLAYGAAHSLARAALRWHGYRTDKRFLVFQLLTHTIGMEPAKVKILTDCHNLRNIAEYEGDYDIGDKTIDALIEITKELQTLVEALGTVG